MSDHENKNEEMPGVVTGTELNTANNYAEEKFHGARGHGYAAERANNLYDTFTGKDAQIVGDDNAKNGADRIVNGANIQSKYCKTGSKCIQECFEDEVFRYYNNDGSPMQIEVPSDKYDDAVKAMQDRIDRGQIQGVSDAKDVVRKGNFTYEQAKNIAKAGTIESLTYDAVNGIITAAYSGGISVAITFWCSYRSGKSFEEALTDAVVAGIQVGGIAFAGAVLSGQLTKAGLNTALVSSSDALVSVIGSKASAQLVNAFRSGTSIYGAAAMKSASKMLRSNAITGIATVLVLSAGDIINIFRGRISAAQLIKNVVNTGAGVAGGVGGWSAGATAGAALGSVVPVIGTAIGGFLGGLAGAFVGGSAASSASKAITDELIEDDSKEMIRIIETEFKNIATDFLLSETEAEAVADNLKYDIDGSTLKDMYASSDRQSFAYDLVEENTAPVIKKRPQVSLPTDEDLTDGLRTILEHNS